jgi:ribose 5-phosphate isomerase B
MKKSIAMASDHTGYQLKSSVMQYLKSENYEVVDLGTTDDQSSVDYPDYAYLASECIIEKSVEVAILVSRLGMDMCIVANRSSKIRAALCVNHDMSRSARMRLDSNVLILPQEILSLDLANEIVSIFLNTEFEGGKHLRRINKIN